MEGLSKLFHQAKQRGVFKGITIRGLICISHLLFVDDILIFFYYDGSKTEITKLKEIMGLFAEASGTILNDKNCYVSYMNLNIESTN